jgi:group I intron endonuclease
MKKFHYVYLTTNLVNGKQYIGDHSTNNNINDNYLGSGRPYFKNALKTYGRKNFKREILEFFDTKDKAFEAQEKYIKQYNTLVPNGYNISPKGGHMFKGSMAKITKLKIGKANKGLKRTDEQNQKNRERNLGKNNPNFGLKRTDETRKKQREAQLGEKSHQFNKRHSVETKNKIRKTLQGIKRSEKTKQKLKNVWYSNRKKVTCEFCNKTIYVSMHNRWHGEKCKYKMQHIMLAEEALQESHMYVRQ